MMREYRKSRSTRIALVIIEAAVLVVCIGYFIRKTDELNTNFQREMDQINCMISRYEAKAQFIEKYLPLVESHTKSGITARRILGSVYENCLWCKLDSELVLSVIAVESGFNPRARSNAGAIGLMQIMPVTGIYVGSRLGIWIGSDKDLYEIETNIHIGCVFLRDCIERLGEENGLGFYYAGRYEQCYEEYVSKIAAARKLWGNREMP